MLTISIITPVLNGSRYLTQAAGTIEEQTLRDHPDIELEWIIVDDHSTDDTFDVATEIASSTPWPTLVHRLDSQRGPAGARNLALDTARGDMFAFLDVDDLWPPDRLDVLVSRLTRDDSLSFVHGTVVTEIDPSSADFWEKLAIDVEPAVAPLMLGTGLYRRDVFDTVGPLDESLWCSEDFDWYLRAIEAGSTYVVIDHVVQRHRLHNENTTRNRSEVARTVQLVLMKSVQRRRRLGRQISYPEPSSLVEPLSAP